MRCDHPQFLELVEDWISVGSLTQQGLVFPQRGIPQGAVVSLILANVYLDDFDENCLQKDLKLVRYADDFVILGQSQEQILDIRSQVTDWLGEMQLLLHPDKTQITSFQRGFKFLGHIFVRDTIIPVKKRQQDQRERTPESPYRIVHSDERIRPTAMQHALLDALLASHQPIPPPLFVVLGYKVSPVQRVKIQSQERSWLAKMATIYLVKQGAKLRKEDNRFVIDHPEEDAIEIPISEVERILVFGTIHLTSATLSTCLNLRIPVIFLSQVGEYKGHLWSAEMEDLKAEAAQFRSQENEEIQLQIAKSIVQGKLINSRLLLLRLNRKRKIETVTKAIDQIQKTIAQINSVSSLSSLRGHEGIGAAHYFPAIGQLITIPDYAFKTRQRRPPPDPINSLLSFGYTLLFNNVLSLLLAEGLNPYLGNLHRSARKQAHLASDLMEEFRSPIVDSLVLTVVNRQVIKPTDFTWPTAEGGVYLTDQARRVFLRAFEQRMDDQTAHPDVQERISYRRAIQLQVRRYKRGSDHRSRDSLFTGSAALLSPI